VAGVRQDVPMSSATGPRVPPLSATEWTSRQQELVERFGVDGHADPLLATLLQVPEIVDGVLPMSHYVGASSTLAPAHRLLLVLRTCWLERSAAVWTSLAPKLPPPDQDLLARAFERAPEPDALNRALFALADELVTTTTVTDATWEALADGHDEQWLMDAVETVTHVAFLACLAHSFGVTGDAPGESEDFIGVPDRAAHPQREPPLTQARIEPLEGDAIAVLRTFARHPAQGAALGKRPKLVNRVSQLTPHDRETLILRIGWDCQSEYEWAKHVGVVGRARDHGVDPEQVAAGPDAPGVDAHDALLMRAADELYMHSSISDSAWVALVDHYGREDAMSAVLAAAAYRSTSMSLNTYGVQLEPGDEGFPNVRRS
jgi:alkylhydroperoxidase family enzyme